MVVDASSPTTMPMSSVQIRLPTVLHGLSQNEVAFFGNCVIEYALLESVTACLNDISICNRYGTRVLKVFQILNRNMAMQTATLRSTESNALGYTIILPLKVGYANF
ncbi:hypothetical protein Tsp_14000 [Trichinella spiralis]|uniref:hypothetical protein n=1 Tax=Trichinella spiralis TaxID=6334 RepID=UPI0001EFE09A|nr:hypothetical protein Tsp_14000 [Trichinella spiralis]